MLPYVIDLESRYEADAFRPYQPQEVIRYALAGTDYWAGLGLRWLDQGAPADGLQDALLDLENQTYRPQAVRQHAHRLRTTL